MQSNFIFIFAKPGWLSEFKKCIYQIPLSKKRTLQRHFNVLRVLGHSNFNNRCFQWFWIFLGHPV